MTAGPSTSTNACWCRATASRSGTAAGRTPTAPSAPPISTTTISSAIPTTTSSRPSATRWICSRSIIDERGWGAARSASRWTITTSRPPPSPRCSTICRTPASRMPTALVNWQRAVKSPTELDYMRKAGRIVEAMHQRIVETIEPGMRKCDLVAEIYDAGIRGVGGIRRRLSGDRAAAALGRRRLGPASDLGRPADAGGRRHVLRDRRLLQALPLPAVAHRLSRQADRRPSSTPRRRRSRAWRPALPPQARQYLRGHRQRLLRGAQAVRHRQGQPHRLSDRPVLSAGLGRAHDEPAARATGPSCGPA